MKRNFLLKTLVILLILITMLANFSFAGNTTTNLKTSLEKMINSNMTVLGNGTRVSSSPLDEGSIVIDDSKIGIKIKVIDNSNNKVEYENFNLINYKLENNVYTYNFDMNGFTDYLDFYFETAGEPKDEMYTLSMLLLQVSLLQNCFLATSEVIGQDISLAYTYFTQEFEKVNTETEININNNIFKFKIQTNESNDRISIKNASLSVNVNNLKSLNKSMVDTSNYYYVIIGQELLSNSKVSNISNKTYTGSSIKPEVTVKYKGIKLEKGTDYIVSYSNNKNPGKATVTIKGTGSFKGTIKKTFIIKPKKLTGLKVKSQKTDSIKLNWSKQTGVTGYKLYSYNYSKNKWEYIGKTKDTLYTIKKLKAGTIYKFRVRAYKNVDGTQYFGSYASSVKTATKTKKPSISKITTTSKKATVKWKKVSGASGYYIYMSTSKNGKYKKIKTVGKSSTSCTKTKLAKNKKYYFKIRSYKTVDGKKIYSSCSSVKSIKIK